MKQEPPPATARPDLLVRCAAASGLVAVAAGAFAAHGLTDARAQALAHTGAAYELAHALAALLCAILARLGIGKARLAAALFLAGQVVFSGSLYALCLGTPGWIGAATPIGGLGLLAGWAVLAWQGARVGQRTAARRD